MIRCIVIDDEPRALEVVKNHIGRMDTLILEEAFTDPLAALKYMEQQQVDLVFLDINMPDINGMQLVRHFPYSPLIIFTTAHSEYAIESYNVDAVDYLLKPFDFSRFMRAVSKVSERIKQEAPTKRGKEPDFFFVNTGFQKRRIVYDAIQYVKGDGNYVHYQTTAGNVMVRSTIKEVCKQLPSDRFVQIHRSYVVALAHIDKIEDNHVFVADARISIGNTYREEFMRLVDSL